jgi:thiaminase/transcriptional activator TenA
VREQMRLMDALGAQASAAEKRRMSGHFLLSSRYEYLFWEQAYRLERWPI